MEQFEFHPSSHHPHTNDPRPWLPLEPGIDELVLNHDPATGRRTTLQRWQPNTKNVKQNFIHDYVEEIYIVEGDFRDTKRSPEVIWEKGAYAYRKPGMEHGPFESKFGCLMFIVCGPKGAGA